MFYSIRAQMYTHTIACDGQGCQSHANEMSARQASSINTYNHAKPIQYTHERLHGSSNRTKLESDASHSQQPIEMCVCLCVCERARATIHECVVVRVFG